MRLLDQVSAVEENVRALRRARGRVSRTAYAAFVLGDPWQLEDLVTSMTRLWANAPRIT